MENTWNIKQKSQKHIQHQLIKHPVNTMFRPLRRISESSPGFTAPNLHPQPARRPPTCTPDPPLNVISFVFPSSGGRLLSLPAADWLITTPFCVLTDETPWMKS